jgi:phosphatidylserine synthase
MNKLRDYMKHILPVFLHVAFCLTVLLTNSAANADIDSQVFFSGIVILILFLLISNAEKREFTREKLNYNIAFPLFSLYIGAMFVVLFYMHPFNKPSGLILIILGLFSLILCGELGKIPNEASAEMESKLSRFAILIVLTLALCLIAIGGWMFSIGTWDWYLS